MGVDILKMTRQHHKNSLPGLRSVDCELSVLEQV